MAAGMIAAVLVTSRRSHGRMRNCRNPSMMTWPAMVPVRVEDCPEHNRAIPKRMLAAVVPTIGVSNWCACWIWVTTIPRVKKTVDRRQQLVRLLDLGHDDPSGEENGGGEHQDSCVHEQRSVQRDDRVDQIEAAGGAAPCLIVGDPPRLHGGRGAGQIVGGE